MKKKVTNADGSVTEVEGSPDEIAEYERLQRRPTNESGDAKKKEILHGSSHEDLFEEIKRWIQQNPSIRWMTPQPCYRRHCDDHWLHPYPYPSYPWEVIGPGLVPSDVIPGITVTSDKLTIGDSTISKTDLAIAGGFMYDHGSQGRQM